MLKLIVFRGWWYVATFALLWGGCMGYLGYRYGLAFVLFISVGAAFGSVAANAVVHWALIRWLAKVSRQLDRTPPGARLWFNEADRDYVKWGKPDDPKRWH